MESKKIGFGRNIAGLATALGGVTLITSGIAAAGYLAYKTFGCGDMDKFVDLFIPNAIMGVGALAAGGLGGGTLLSHAKDFLGINEQEQTEKPKAHRKRQQPEAPEASGI